MYNSYCILILILILIFILSLNFLMAWLFPLLDRIKFILQLLCNHVFGEKIPCLNNLNWVFSNFHANSISAKNNPLKSNISPQPHKIPIRIGFQMKYPNTLIAIDLHKYLRRIDCFVLPFNTLLKGVRKSWWKESVLFIAKKNRFSYEISSHSSFQLSEFATIPNTGSLF